MMPLPGLAAWGAYKILVHFYPELALGLYAERKAIAGIIATFAFTMAGFIAAIITFMFNYYESKTFTVYRKKGYFDVFLSFYYFSIFWLMVTCFLSLFCFTNTTNIIGNVLFFLLFANFFNNVVHIYLIAFSIYRLVKDAADEAS